MPEYKAEREFNKGDQIVKAGDVVEIEFGEALDLPVVRVSTEPKVEKKVEKKAK